MRTILQRPFAESLIDGYFSMGTIALENGQFKVAYKMFRAAFEEPSSKAQKHKHLLPLLVSLGRTHEGLGQLYKAKLLYIRALAQYRKEDGNTDMFVVGILCTLAKVTARQGLFRQSWQFVEQAVECYRSASEQNSRDFALWLSETAAIFASKGRTQESDRIHALILDMQEH